MTVRALTVEKFFFNWKKCLEAARSGFAQSDLNSHRKAEPGAKRSGATGLSWITLKWRCTSVLFVCRIQCGPGRSAPGFGCLHPHRCRIGFCARQRGVVV